MPNLKDLLRTRLSKKELELLVKSFDVIGDLAVIDIPKELVKKESLIAKAILAYNKNINGVFKKSGIHSGVYRTQRIKFLAGENRKISSHKESGVSILLDIEKCYFSPRLSNERLRIARLIKPEEKVLVMFSGVGPYPLVIAKNSLAKEIYGIELNPISHRFAMQNVVRNKVEDKVKLLRGDVRKEVAKLNKKFDRIVIPLPKSGEKYLKHAFRVSKKGTAIHLYTFLREDKFSLVGKRIKKRCNTYKKNCKILRVIKCGEYSPGVYRACIDFKI